MRNKSDYRIEVKIGIYRLIEQLKARGVAKLPSEQQLAKKFQISRETLRSLYSQLEMEGLIFRKHGSGTFINYHTSDAGLVYPCEDYGKVIEKNGYIPSVQGLPTKMYRSNTRISEALRLTGNEVFCLPLLMLADERPCILILYYLHPEMDDPNIVKFFHDVNHDIADILDQVALKNDTLLLWDDMEMLSLPSSAMPEEYREIFGAFLPQTFFIQDSVFYDTENNPICFSRSFIDTTKIRFHMIRYW